MVNKWFQRLQRYEEKYNKTNNFAFFHLTSPNTAGYDGKRNTLRLKTKHAKISFTCFFDLLRYNFTLFFVSLYRQTIFNAVPDTDEGYEGVQNCPY